jgi:hypothetical protein
MAAQRLRAGARSANVDEAVSQDEARRITVNIAELPDLVHWAARRRERVAVLLEFFRFFPVERATSLSA